MHRFYLKEIPKTNVIEFSDKRELHHMLNVLRINKGDDVELLDGKGGLVLGKIEEVNSKKAKLKVNQHKHFKKNSNSLNLTVACALIKREKVELIVEKLTEIGVDKIIFLETERTQVKLKHQEKLRERLEKIAISALKQCGNVFLPEIDFMDFNQLLDLRGMFDLALMPCLAYKTKPLSQVLMKSNNKSVLLAIGPVGDFSVIEIQKAIKSGFIPVSLGKNVLRTETAAILAAGCITIFSG